MRRHTRLALVAALASSAVSVSMPVFAVPSEQDITSAQSHEQGLSASLAAVELELADLSAASTLLQTQEQEAQEALEEANLAVYRAIDDAGQAQERADQAQMEVDNARSNMAAIAQAMYRDSASQLENAYSFFDAASFSAAHDRTRAYSSVIKQTDQRAREFRALKAAADSLQAQADAKLKDSQTFAQQAKDAQDKAQQAANDARNQLREAGNRRDELAVQLAEAKHTTVELEKERLAYAEAQRQAQIEAQTKAAAEAKEKEQKRKAQAAAEAARQEAEKDKQRAAAAASSAPAAPSVQAVPSPAAPAPTPQPVPAVASGGSAMRAQILAYARQFDGVPYVWGGTSPVTGWDCSGFVQYVYKHFGINLPRGGDSQAYTGRQISASEAEPGDLVWWPGQHVAIYAGNGRIYAAHTYGIPTGESPIWGSYVFVRLIE